MADSDGGMRLPRPRITIRRLMIAVAIVALLLGAELTRRRRAFCVQQASYYADWERTSRSYAEDFEKEARIAARWPEDEWARGFAEENEREARLFRSNESRYARLKQAYERVASRPWLPLPLEKQPSGPSQKP
jgi:hypothetical protein